MSDNNLTIKSIQFGIFSPYLIKKHSVLHVLYPETLENGLPKKDGLSDPRLGVIDNSLLCSTCHLNCMHCQGHFGHIELTKPVFHVNFLNRIKKVLESVCYYCSSIKNAKISVENYITKQNLRNNLNLVWQNNKTKLVCDVCGHKQPIIRKEGMNLLAFMKGNDAEGKMILTAEKAYSILTKISDENIERLGFNVSDSRPEWMILTTLLVSPPSCRPAVQMDNLRGEDDLTHKYADIIKANNNLKRYESEGAPSHILRDYEQLLQFHVATLMDNEISGQPQALQKNGRPLKSLSARLKGKEGRLRYNLMGKRVDFSARTVITPDPNISLDEVGVPLQVAMTHTFSETVNSLNFERMKELVKNGPNNHPGANYVVRLDGQRIDLRFVRSEVPLMIGFVVERHLMDGDYVLFNRQPSLHKMSMMGHRVRVMDKKTFRLNLSVTTPYNADFDGDEMNLHAPQSLLTVVELKELASVVKQIVSPQSNKPVMGIVQDSLIGVRRLTSDDTFIDMKDAMQIFHNANLHEKFSKKANENDKTNEGDLHSDDSDKVDFETRNSNEDYFENKNEINHVNNFNFDYTHFNLNDSHSAKNLNFDNAQSDLNDSHSDNNLNFDNTHFNLNDSHSGNNLNLNLENFDLGDSHSDNNLNLNGKNFDLDDSTEKQFGQNCNYFNLNSLKENGGFTDNFFNQNNIKDNSDNKRHDAASNSALNISSDKNRSSISCSSLALNFSSSLHASSSLYNLHESPEHILFASQTKKNIENISNDSSSTDESDLSKIKSKSVHPSIAISSIAIPTKMSKTYSEFEKHIVRKSGPIDFLSSKVLSEKRAFSRIVNNDIYDKNQLNSFLNKCKTNNAQSKSLLRRNLINKYNTILTENNGVLHDNSFYSDDSISENETNILEIERPLKNKLDFYFEKYSIPTKKESEKIYGKCFKQTENNVKSTKSSINKKPLLKSVVFNNNKLTNAANLPIIQRDFSNESSSQKCLAINAFSNNSYSPSIFDFNTPIINTPVISTPNSYEPIINTPTTSDNIYSSYSNNSSYDACSKFSSNNSSCFPKPTILRPVVLYTGKQVFSWSLPKINFKTLSTEEKPVLIIDGRLHEGVIDKKSVGTCEGGIIHVIFNDFGSSICRSFFDYLQRIVCAYMFMISSFSVGIGDTIPSKILKQEIKQSISSAIEQVDKLIQDPTVIQRQPGMSLRETFESLINLHLNKARNISGTCAQKELREGNNVKQMVLAGSKGSIINISQMTACVGQQNVEGRRIPFGFRNRSLPHFCKDDYSARSRGFVKNSYLTGLTPEEFFFHAMGGREGLIDTAVKTAETGYIQRRLVKAMEDLKISFDGSVRAGNGALTQFVYGDDSLAGESIERSKAIRLVDIEKKLHSDEEKKKTRSIKNDSEKESDKSNVNTATNLNADNDKFISLAKSILNYSPVYSNNNSFNFIVSELSFLNSVPPVTFYMPLNLHRIFWNAKRLYSSTHTDFDFNYYMEQIKDLILTQNSAFCKNERSLLYLKSHLSLSNILISKINKDQFDYILKRTKELLKKSQAPINEMVGTLAAQSVGEPATQMTLNTFHFAGVASTVTLGVPRLKEIINIAKTLKTPSMKLILKDEFSNSIAGAKKAQIQIEYAEIKDVIEYCQLIYEPLNATTVIEEDRELVETYYELLEDEEREREDHYSHYVIRLVLNREVLVGRGIHIQDVVDLINNSTKIETNKSNPTKNTTNQQMPNNSQEGNLFNNSNDHKISPGHRSTSLISLDDESMSYNPINALNILSSDENADLLVIRIKSTRQTLEENKTILNKILLITLGGYKNIKKVFVVEEMNKFVLQTEGLNLKDLLSCPIIQANKAHSNSIIEVYQVLGVEAARAVILKELRSVIENEGYVNIRHLMLLADVMTVNGILCGITRHGVNRNQKSALMRCSFEETVEILMEAAIIGEKSSCKEVTESIILGQNVPIGTGLTELFINTDLLINAIKISDKDILADVRSPISSFSPIIGMWSPIAESSALGKTYKPEEHTIHKSSINDLMIHSPNNTNIYSPSTPINLKGSLSSINTSLYTHLNKNVYSPTSPSMKNSLGSLNYSPVNKMIYSPVNSYSPTTPVNQSTFTPISRNTYIPTSPSNQNMFSPTNRNIYSPTNRNIYSPTNRNIYSPTNRNIYSPSILSPIQNSQNSYSPIHSPNMSHTMISSTNNKNKYTSNLQYTATSPTYSKEKTKDEKNNLFYNEIKKKNLKYKPTNDEEREETEETEEDF